MIGAVHPASSILFLISGTAAAASGTFTVHRTISEPASASSKVCFNVVSMSAVSVFVMDCTTMGAPPPTRTCPTFTPYVFRRGWRLAAASNPSICVSIPYNSSVIWPFLEIEYPRRWLCWDLRILSRIIDECQSRRGHYKKWVAGTQAEEFAESLSLKTKFGQTVNPALRADSFSIGNFSLRFF